MTARAKHPRPAEPIIRALLSSFLLICSFPGPDAGWLSAVALVPLLTIVVRVGKGRAFLLGWLCGTVWFAVSLNWLTQTIRLYGGLPLVASGLLILLLGCVLGLYIGIFALTVRCISDWPGAWWFLVIPPAWVLIEYARSWIPAPFPWLLLGTVFWKYPAVSGFYGLFGVYGLSFILVLVNALVWRTLEDRRRPGGGRLAAVRLVAFMVPVLLMYLALSVQGATDEEASIRIGIVQGNYDQGLKWSESLKEEIVRTYVGLSDQAAAAGASLILWPETSVTSYFQSDTQLSGQLRAFSRQRDVHLVFGSPAFQWREGRHVLYNRAYHLAPDGGVRSYDKIRLVPFGEYVPFRPLLSFAARLVPGEGQFVPGKPTDPFPLSVPAGPLICYEASMPDLSRDQVRRGARILLNLTNDAWFGTSWGPYQHLAMAAVRAAELRTPLLRAANTGISAVIDDRGRIVKRLGLLERGVIVADVTPGSGGTMYSRWGDWIVYLSILMIIFIGLGKIRKIYPINQGGKGHDPSGRFQADRR
ncbi:MAG: apolipoprotein N-acyltransferase [bacterium]|nr:MAG: apolipoprotein N-acyltransferase [bacterium]